MLSRRSFLQVSSLLATACGHRAAVESPADLYRRATVIDGNLVPPIPDGPLSPEVLAALRSSGITALKLSIGGTGASHDEARQQIDNLAAAIARLGVYMQIRRVADIEVARRAGKVGIIFSFEAVTPLDGKLEHIDEFAALGVRVMQLSYNTPSPFAAGVMSPQPSSGLTALGAEAVARMNARGVTLDLSHADERSTQMAIAASRQPVLITHAGCNAVHLHPRNKSDAVLRALAGNGGTIGIYDLSYLSGGPAQQSVEDYLAHMTYALKVCGEDHVGIGSDSSLMPFDTSPESRAEWAAEVAHRQAAGIAAPDEGRLPYVEGLNVPNRPELIASALLKRGYPARVAEKVLGSNFQRVFAQTWL
jgi:membrane dipeptidase